MLQLRIIMTTFGRRGHFRTNENGTTFWVRDHAVHRDHWDVSGLGAHYGSSLYKASDFLRRSNVGRGKQGCFVTPNAKCPVCGVPVFYYQNAFGSRVFFDDLGPPWPKHPCTDNPMNSLSGVAWAPIARRKKGEIQELIAAGNATGLFQQKRFGQLTASEWTLLVVEDVLRSGEREVVRAAIIDSAEPKLVQFSCFSPTLVFNLGDFVSKRGSEFSFFDRSNMQTVNFRDGARLSFGLETKEPVVAPETKFVQDGSRADEMKARPRPFDPTRFSRVGMKRNEESHFPKAKNLRQAFVARLRPKIERMIAEGLRAPEQFALRLNSAGERTKSGGLWTPRLTVFLLSYMFERAAEKKPKPAPEPRSENIANMFGGGVGFEKLSAMAMPTLQRLKKRGIEEPREIANTLNSAKLYPSKKSRWTARAVSLLIELHEAGFKRDADFKAALEQGGATRDVERQPTSPTAVDVSRPMDRDELARRLSAIGRVSIKGGTA
jgi:hypothetical protein